MDILPGNTFYVYIESLTLMPLSLPNSMIAAIA